MFLGKTPLFAFIRFNNFIGYCHRRKWLKTPVIKRKDLKEKEGPSRSCKNFMTTESNRNFFTFTSFSFFLLTVSWEYWFLPLKLSQRWYEITKWRCPKLSKYVSVSIRLPRNYKISNLLIKITWFLCVYCKIGRIFGCCYPFRATFVLFLFLRISLK